MGTSVCRFVRQRKASNSSQANALEEMEVAGDDAEITSGIVPQLPNEADFDDAFHPVPQADNVFHPVPPADDVFHPVPQGDDVLDPIPQADDKQSSTNKANDYNCVPKEAVSSAPGVMCDKTGGTRRCNETFSAQCRGTIDIDQPVTTTHDYGFVKEAVASNQISIENEYNELSNTGNNVTSSLQVTCQAEKTQSEERRAAASYIFTENSMRIFKDNNSLTAIIPPLSLMVANNGKDYDDMDIVPSKDHASYVDIVRRKH